MAKTRPKSLESVREKMRAAAQQSGKTQEEIGIAMGFSKTSARQAVSRLLNTEIEYDPRLTTLIQFAAAIDCSLPDILS
jgi:transcriptional regulator with XRE-family HTH domain